MQAIKVMLAIIIALLSIVVIELANIIALLHGKNGSAVDLGVPIVILVTLGTLFILINVNLRSGINRNDRESQP